MSHETREGRKIGEELRHNHVEAAHKEISHEMHAHPKEFEKTLRSINKDLAKHHENPLSVERDSKNQISHINFNNHDIYSSPKAAEAKRAAAPDAPKSASGEVQGPGATEAQKSSAPEAAKLTPGDTKPTTGEARNPERESRDYESHQGRHHHQHHKHKHGGKHGRGGGGDTDSEESQENNDPKNDGKPGDGKPGDADPNAKPGESKDSANKDVAGGPKDPNKAQDGSATASGADGLRGRDNAEKAMNYFMDKGLTKAQAAGIVGNLDHEAPGVNPNQHQHGGPGFGIAQWEGPRKREEKEFAKEQGKTADDLKTQLDFAWKELNTTHRGALRGVERSHTPSQAARAFERGFEAASRPHMKAREQSALSAYNRPTGDFDGELLASNR
jgi:hypothetical protein